MSRHQLVVVASGLAVTALVVVAASSWRALLTEFHLHSLRRDPERLVAYLQASDDTPERRAALELLETQEGKRALFRAFIEKVATRVFQQDSNRSPHVETALVCLGATSAMHAGNAPHVSWFDSGSSFATWPDESDVRAVQRQLHGLSGKEFTSSSYSCLRFRFMRPETAQEALRSSGYDTEQISELGIQIENVCLITRSPEESVERLVQQLSTSNTGAQLHAAMDLLAYGSRAANAAPVLVGKLSSSEEIGPIAVAALKSIGKPAVPFLSESLSAGDWTVRGRALAVLGSIGRDSAEAVESIAKRLSDDSDTVRGQAAWALGEIGEEAKTFCLPLILLLADESEFVRNLAASAIVKIAPPNVAVVSALVHALRFDLPDTRKHAATILGNFGPAAEAAIPALVSALNDADEEVRKCAADALNRIRVEEP